MMNFLPLFATAVFSLTAMLASAQAVLLAPDTISTGDVFGLTLTPDNRTAYYVKSYGGRDTLHIFETRLQGLQWKKPRRVQLLTGTAAYIDPFISPDGQYLLFNSNEGNQPGNFDVYLAKRKGSGWSRPRKIEGDINSDSSDFYATMARNGNIYFASMRQGGSGGVDIWMSEYRNNKYLPSRNVGPRINSSGHDSNPYIAPDESFLIFYSRRTDSYGDVDLYISFNEKGEWMEPVNLGPAVNSSSGEFCPFISADGKTFYFSRNDKIKGRIVENIYQLPVNKIEVLKKRK